MVNDGKTGKAPSRKTSVVCDAEMFRLINDYLSDTKPSLKNFSEKPIKRKEIQSDEVPFKVLW